MHRVLNIALSEFVNWEYEKSSSFNHEYKSLEKEKDISAKMEVGIKLFSGSAESAYHHAMKEVLDTTSSEEHEKETYQKTRIEYQLGSNQVFCDTETTVTIGNQTVVKTKSEQVNVADGSIDPDELLQRSIDHINNYCLLSGAENQTKPYYEYVVDVSYPDPPKPPPPSKFKTIEDCINRKVKISTVWNGKTMYLDVYGGRFRTGTNVQFWPGNNSAAQHWKITNEGGGQYAIRSWAVSNLVLDFHRENKNVYLNTPNQHSRKAIKRRRSYWCGGNQLWRIVRGDEEGGYVFEVSEAHGRVIDYNYSNGNCYAGSLHGKSNQRMRLEFVY